MIRSCSVLVLLCLPLAVRADEVPPPTGDTIVPRGAKLELLFTRSADIKGGLTEGPACAPDGSIYFSDIPFGKDKGQILRFDPRSGKTTVFTADSYKSNGLKFDAKGDLIACEGSDEGGRCVSRWNVKTGKRTVIADRYMGKRFNAPNDLAIDTKGRIYFTDPRYLGEEPRELEHRAVYRIDTDGKVIEVTHDVEKPNGIALSPDGKTLYVADHNNGTDRIVEGAPAPKPGAMKVYAFPLGADGLVSGKRRTIYDWGTEAGCDGMCVDAKGTLVMTSRSLKRPGVLVTDPEGKELAFIPTGPSQPGTKKPVGIPSNVTFGRGAESKTLYVTIDKSLYRIKLLVEGYHPE
jgi:gluconolactonase